MTNHGTIDPPRLDIKSWWTAFMVGVVTGGFLAATAAVVTVMAASPG